MALIIPAMSALVGADVKSEIIRMAGLCREVYARAAISGLTHRLTIDLDNQHYWVEVKEGDAGVIAPELGYEELLKNLVNKDQKEKEQSPEYDYVPRYQNAEGELGEKQALSKNLVFYGVWTEHMSEASRSGIVSIYFFADHTQNAFISVAEKGDEEDSALYLALSPLTGAVSIDLGEPAINTLLEGERESEE